MSQTTDNSSALMFPQAGLSNYSPFEGFTDGYDCFMQKQTSFDVQSSSDNLEAMQIEDSSCSSSNSSGACTPWGGSSKKRTPLGISQKSQRICSESRFIPSRKNSKMHIAFENKPKTPSSCQMKPNSINIQDENRSETVSIASLYQKHVLATSDNQKILSFNQSNTSCSQRIPYNTSLISSSASTLTSPVIDPISYDENSRSLYQPSTRSSILAKPPKQLIVTDSTKILDAPGLEDDYYLNLLHWSANNVISVVLKNEVFGYNCTTRQIFSLQKPDKFNTFKFTSVKFSKSGRLLAIGDSLGGVQVIDAETRQEVGFYQNHEDRVASLAWIDDEILASGSKDKNILCQDLRDKSIIRKYVGHKNEVCGLEWSCDQQSLASGGNDDKLFVWNIAYNNFQYKFSQHQAAVKAIAWSPHQHGLLASGGGSRDKTIRFWNIHSGKQVDCIETNSQVCSLAFSQNTNQFVSTHGFADNEIYVWQYPNPKKVKIFQGHQQRVIYMAIGPDQKQIVTGSSDETLRFWDAFPDRSVIKAPESILKFSDLR